MVRLFLNMGDSWFWLCVRFLWIFHFKKLFTFSSLSAGVQLSGPGAKTKSASRRLSPISPIPDALLSESQLVDSIENKLEVSCTNK